MPRGLLVRMGENITPDMRVGRAFGQIFTGLSNGSFTVPYADQGTPFATLVPLTYYYSGYPRVWVSGDTFYWDFQNIPAAERQNARILYGRY